MKIEKKWQENDLRLKRLTNNDLDCRNCVYKFDDTEIFGNTSKCEKFPQVKPVSVLKKGKCPVKEVKKP